MSVPELQEQLKALEERLMKEKAEKDSLLNQNELLKGQIGATAPNPKLDDTLDETVVSPPPLEIVYLPKEKKCSMFSGKSGTLSYYDWLDDLESSVSFNRYKGRERAAYIYDHLEGEARQEIKHSVSEIRQDPDEILHVLKETYGHPLSLTKAQKCFFDRKQKEGESLREYCHELLSLARGVNRCKGGRVCVTRRL